MFHISKHWEGVEKSNIYGSDVLFEMLQLYINYLRKPFKDRVFARKKFLVVSVGTLEELSRHLLHIYAKANA